jgi:hypothetical protein
MNKRAERRQELLKEALTMPDSLVEQIRREARALPQPTTDLTELLSGFDRQKPDTESS